MSSSTVGFPAAGRWGQGTSRRGRVLLIMALVCWPFALGFGMWKLAVHQNTPGRGSEFAQSWPADTQIPRLPGVPTLLMFGHPKCPCTRASIGELEKFMPAAVAAGGKGFLIFIMDDEGQWSDTDTVQMARQIPGITVIFDPVCEESARFSAHTSGQVLAFDGAGSLQFSGGITGGRGHAGDNPGARAARAVLTGMKSSVHHTPVFGCSL